jgi:transposase InsO family protein
MQLHANATSTPRTRLLMCQRATEQGWTLKDAAAAAGLSERRAHHWLARYRTQGPAGLQDRSSAPRTVPARTPPERVRAILGLRATRMTAAQIAEALGMPHSTVSAVLGRAGQGRLSRSEPAGPANRYERRHAGELVHVDIKKLVRIERPGHRVHGDRRTRVKGAGWEYVHVAIDDASRLAYAEVLPDERAPSVVGFLERVVAFFGSRGVGVQRVLTDNGPGYLSTLHALCCKRLGIAHRRTRPYTPRTNGKAERFIQTLVNGWAYGQIYSSSLERTAALEPWIHWYNHSRPHGSLQRQTPAARLKLLMSNAAGNHI